jgi:hypothetical protein
VLKLFSFFSQTLLSRTVGGKFQAKSNQKYHEPNIPPDTCSNFSLFCLCRYISVAMEHHDAAGLQSPDDYLLAGVQDSSDIGIPVWELTVPKLQLQDVIRRSR